MKKRMLPLLLLAAALVLELLPYGAVCRFANPAGEPWRETFSYFSLTPFGYANFAPFVTALLTCAAVLTGALYCAAGKTAAVTRGLLIAAVIVSLGPLTLGVENFSVVGVLITLSLLAALLAIRREKETA